MSKFVPIIVQTPEVPEKATQQRDIDALKCSLSALPIWNGVPNGTKFFGPLDYLIAVGGHLLVARICSTKMCLKSLRENV